MCEVITWRLFCFEYHLRRSCDIATTPRRDSTVYCFEHRPQNAKSGTWGQPHDYVTAYKNILASQLEQRKPSFSDKGQRSHKHSHPFTNTDFSVRSSYSSRQDLIISESSFIRELEPELNNTAFLMPCVQTSCNYPLISRVLISLFIYH